MSYVKYNAEINAIRNRIEALEVSEENQSIVELLRSRMNELIELDKAISDTLIAKSISYIEDRFRETEKNFIIITFKSSGNAWVIQRHNKHNNFYSTWCADDSTNKMMFSSLYYLSKFLLCFS